MIQPNAWPAWWEWDLAFSAHFVRRMQLRHLSESDLREMLEDASGLEADAVFGRWKIAARWQGEPWEIILEPDEVRRRLVVVTGYRVE